MTALTWYSINKELNPDEQPPVELATALDIARRYYANGAKTYPTPEDGAVETMFGFMRGKDIWIQFTIDQPDSITFIFEMTPEQPKKKSFFSFGFKDYVQHSATLRSLAAIERTITDFFTLEPQAFYNKILIDTLPGA